MSTAGRGAQGTVSKTAGQNISTAQGLENQGQQLASSELDTSGGLSPLVSRQLASNEGQINKAYTGAAQGALKGLAQRGMSAAPSGQTASLENTEIQNRGAADTGAIGNAFGTQNSLNQVALNPALAAEGVTNQSLGTATGANQALAQMPSTAANVFSGLEGLGNTAANIGKGFNLCWIAARAFSEDFYTGTNTQIVREWLISWETSSLLGRVVVMLYRKFGERLSKIDVVVNLLRPLFYRILKGAKSCQ